ncbi:hypothetical protein MnTg04_01569 [bacterium MnTg04]|nr:hypothetical protein MnTg04_01569 [bacterium MnTg04]
MHRLFQVVQSALALAAAGNQVHAVRCRVECLLRRQRLVLLEQQRHFQCGGHGARDFFLDFENIIELPVISLRPNVITVRHADQLGGNAYLITGFSDTAFEHMIDIELAADFPQVDIPPLVIKRRSPAGDFQVLDVGQHIQQFFGQAIGKIFVLDIRTHADERQDRDAFYGIRVGSGRWRFLPPEQGVLADKRDQRNKQHGDNDEVDFSPGGIAMVGSIAGGRCSPNPVRREVENPGQCDG